MTGHAYATSARTAARLGPFEGFDRERGAHAAGADDAPRRQLPDRRTTDVVPDDLLAAGQRAWEDAVRDGHEHGVRNSQASVLAPTGTIGLMMDCDTTGIEPDLGLVKMKKLVGGGTMSIVNQTIPRALRRLGYDAQQVDDIIAYIDEQQVDPRRSAPGGRARLGVRLLDGRQHDPLRGSRPDDGRGPAVPVGRDLQDGQHARGGAASKTSRRCTSSAGSSA